MHRTGFKRCEADHCCRVKFFGNSYIILLLYVDDMLIAGSSIEEINNLKKQLSKQFAMKDLGATHASLSFVTSSLTALECSLDERQKGYFLGGNRWIDIQMVTNETWVHPQGFISIPREYIYVFS